MCVGLVFADQSRKALTQYELSGAPLGWSTKLAGWRKGAPSAGSHAL